MSHPTEAGPSAVQILCAVPLSLPSALYRSLCSSSYDMVSLLQQWKEEVTVDDLSPHIHPLPQWWKRR